MDGQLPVSLGFAELLPDSHCPAREDWVTRVWIPPLKSDHGKAGNRAQAFCGYLARHPDGQLN